MTVRYVVTPRSIPLLLVLAHLVNSAKATAATPSSPVPNDTRLGADDAAGGPATLGWTWNEGRGTADIIWTSLTTLFLCSWSVLCVNVPAPGSSAASKAWRKLLLTCLCALAPELIFGLAYAQRLAAGRSVRLFESDGAAGGGRRRREWTITHAFYAEMGGFVLRPRANDTFTRSFPITAAQLHYLVARGHLEMPDVSRADIRDKNKSDVLLRAIAIAQAAWFVVNVLARAAQGLVVTTLELTACAFVLSSVATQACWRHKPADIDVPTPVTPKATIADILRAAGPAAARPYTRTPLDFVDRGEWWWSALWLHGRGYLRAAGVDLGVGPPPIQRFENTNAPELGEREYWVMALVSAAYFSIFFAAWHYPFPTPAERALWRAACVATMACMLAGTLMKVVSYDLVPALDRRRRRQQQPADPEAVLDGAGGGARRRGDPGGRVGRLLDSIRNNSTMREPERDAPAKAVILCWVVGVFYLGSRIYFWVADFAGLRSLPASAYDTVQWWRVLPSF